jgi:hypothetical protein
MNRAPASIITMLREDRPELSSIHLEFLKTWPIWESMMQCYTIGEALDLTYIYNRESMPIMAGINADWPYVMETNSLGLAMYLCDIGKEPLNLTSYVQSAFDRGFPWIVYMVLRRFPRQMTLILDTGWSKHVPVPMEGRVENCMQVMKAWSEHNYSREIWSLMVPKHFAIHSAASWTMILELNNAPWELFWQHRKTSCYLSQQSISQLFKVQGMTDDFRWEVLQSEAGWDSFIVDMSYQSPTSPWLREQIQKQWPNCRPSMPSWFAALQRGDIHAVQSNRHVAYWPKEALLGLLYGKSNHIMEILQDIDTWNRMGLTHIMCDIQVGKAIMCTKNDDLMLECVKRTIHSCYEPTPENHRLLIQFRMTRTLSYLHIKKIQMFDETTFVTAISEGFVDLLQILLQKANIPKYDETLWYKQLLHIYVTRGHTVDGQRMAQLLVDYIPRHVDISPMLQEQINLMT